MEEHDELVAAEAAEVVAGGEASAGTDDDLLQQLVACTIAEQGVGVAEAVDVEVEAGEGLALQPGGVEGFGQVAAHGCAVGQAGEFVVQGAVEQVLALEALAADAVGGPKQAEASDRAADAG